METLGVSLVALKQISRFKKVLDNTKNTYQEFSQAFHDIQNAYQVFKNVYQEFRQALLILQSPDEAPSGAGPTN